MFKASHGWFENVQKMTGIQCAVRQKQSSLDRFFVKVKPSEPQPDPSREKRQKREREKTPDFQIPEVLLEIDSPSKQHPLLFLRPSQRHPGSHSTLLSKVK